MAVEMFDAIRYWLVEIHRTYGGWRIWVGVVLIAGGMTLLHELT